MSTERAARPLVAGAGLVARAGRSGMGPGGQLGRGIGRLHGVAPGPFRAELVARFGALLATGKGETRLSGALRGLARRGTGGLAIDLVLIAWEFGVHDVTATLGEALTGEQPAAVSSAVLGERLVARFGQLLGTAEELDDLARVGYGRVKVAWHLDAWRWVNESAQVRASVADSRLG